MLLKVIKYNLSRVVFISLGAGREWLALFLFVIIIYYVQLHQALIIPVELQL